MTLDPQTAADIRSVLTRWMQADDAGRDVEWVDGYITDDFVFMVGTRRFAGRDEIRALNAARADGPPRGIHILSEPALTEEGGDVVRAATPFVYVTSEAHGFAVTIAGVYNDEFVRGAEGGWQCRCRHTTHLPADPGGGR